MFYRMMKDHNLQDQLGRPVLKKKGELVDVVNRHTEARLLSLGVIGPVDYSSATRDGKASGPFARTRRVGIFLFTTPYYSGGRIHLYQYAWALAKGGAEVFMVTNAVPRWARDYPPQARLRILIHGTDPIPPDLDLIITDSKTDLGKKALAWKKRHPWVPFVCFNFETPNWVQKFCPAYAKRLHQSPEIFKAADFLLSNSRESDRHLLKWLGRPNAISAVLPPAANTAAIAKAREAGPMKHDRPYAVWSSRSAEYKGGDVALDAVKALPFKFDLVMIGQPNRKLRGDPHHRFIPCTKEGDVEKFRWMLGASLVLAPSKFEGYGMVPAEALCCGVPCVVYDLPVLREEYGDRLIYAPWGNRKAYIEKVRRALDKKAVLPEAVRDEAPRRYGLDSTINAVRKLSYRGGKKKKVSVQMISYWGLLPESLESVYPHADEIVVAFGPDDKAPRVDDGSLDVLRAFPDPDRKIRIEVRKEWKDKLEMRSWCLSKVSGDYHILLDGDEIWTGLGEWLRAGIPFGCPRWLNFWHDAGFWIHDGPTSDRQRWGKLIEKGGRGSVCPHYRCSWLRASYRFRRHPTLVDSSNRLLHVIGPDAAKRCPKAIIYHFGHALPSQVMRAKHEYYIRRDGNDAGRRKRREAWAKWKRGKTGSCGDGVVEKVNWELPEIIQRANARLRPRTNAKPVLAPTPAPTREAVG